MKSHFPVICSALSIVRVCRILFFATLTLGFFVTDRPVLSQIVSAVDVLKSGRFEPPYRYRPSDPWTRTLATTFQTGHIGKFYNCDGEEAKRNSPWITWKTHCERDLPTKVGCLDRWRCQIAEVKQRIADGACCTASPCSDECVTALPRMAPERERCTSCEVCLSGQSVPGMKTLEESRLNSVPKPVPNAASRGAATGGAATGDEASGGQFASPRVAANLEDLGARR